MSENPTLNELQANITFPLDEIIKNMGLSIASAQRALDENSLLTEMEIAREGLSQYGMRATWYTLPETNLNLKIALKVTQEGSLTVQLLDSNYYSDFDFEVEGSSDITTKFVSQAPEEIFGLSKHDKDAVLRKAGEYYSIIQAYDEALNPYVFTMYQPFTQLPYDYKGGLWYVIIYDSIIEKSGQVQAAAVIDDLNLELIWIGLYDEDVSKGDIDTGSDDSGDDSSEVDDSNTLDMYEDQNDDTIPDNNTPPDPEVPDTTDDTFIMLNNREFTTEEFEYLLKIFNEYSFLELREIPVTKRLARYVTEKKEEGIHFDENNIHNVQYLSNNMLDKLLLHIREIYL